MNKIITIVLLVAGVSLFGEYFFGTMLMNRHYDGKEEQKQEPDDIENQEEHY